ncbi:MAG: molybdenum cofactor biosynthesis protein B [Acidobacteriota bacterium]|nr:molybdenum cofactor biosynthesis protein MoaB [Blastocatellia bacterium]MDW8238868.1 molybdenum cofactor biosynthesis protein B [Acidobacteriota bacterium]
MSHIEHKRQARGPVGCAVVTVSDSRTPETDTSGHLIQQQLIAHGHIITSYQIIKDEPEQLRAVLTSLVADDQCQAVIFNGGTGISRRDSTFDALDSLLEKRLPGFGELFRFLSYQEIGAAAMLSRAVAGTYQGRIVISIPGSPAAARLAMEKLILPELAHMVREVHR